MFRAQVGLKKCRGGRGNCRRPIKKAAAANRLERQVMVSLYMQYNNRSGFIPMDSFRGVRSGFRNCSWKPWAPLGR